MAGAIDLVARAAGEVLPSPVGSSPNRSVPQRTEGRIAPDRSSTRLPGESMPPTAVPGGQCNAAMLENDENTGLAKKTILVFERDDRDGKLYLYIKDKRSGEEILRIPGKLLEDASLLPEPSSRVDVRI